MKVVLDVNVFVAAALASSGVPAMLIRAWQTGVFELVVSPMLLSELRRVLAYPKLRDKILPEEAAALLPSLGIDAMTLADPDSSSSAVTSRDPNDNYLIALAEQADALLVSGDKDLVSLAGQLKVATPAEFHQFLVEAGLIESNNEDASDES